MSLTSLMVTTVVVQNPSRAAVTGGFDVTWDTAATVKGRVQPMSAQERAQWAKDTDDIMATCYLKTPDAATITNASRIVAASTTYSVLAKRDFDHLNRLTAVYLQEVQD